MYNYKFVNIKRMCPSYKWRNGREGRDWAVDEELDEADDGEVNICDASKLLE